MVSCPQCASHRAWKDGFGKTRDGDVQRFVCRSCGFRFSENRNRAFEHRFHRQVGVTPSPRRMINLTTVEPLKEGLAGATKDTKGKIIEFSWWLKKEGYAESTIRIRSRILKRLVRLGADLYDPENVKDVIASRSSWCISTKASVVDTYDSFLKMLGIEWNLPRYREERPLPFIPTESEIDSLIAGCGSKTAAFLQLLKETGMRVGEACNLEWTDVDTERRLIHLRKAEKGSNPRIFKVSS